MNLCRSTWQRLAPITHRGSAALLRNAPVRQMSSSSVPGSTGDSLPYYLFLGVAFTGGGVYVYRTLSSDKARFRDRHDYINTQLKPTFEAYDDEDKSEKANAEEVSESIEEAAESAVEEAAAEEETMEQEAVQAASQEQLLAEEAVPATTEHEPVPSSEAAAVQEQDVIEPAAESSDVETVPILEASSDSIPEELASAAEDWTELSARKPEEVVEESAPAEQVSDEEAEPEKASASS